MMFLNIRVIRAARTLSSMTHAFFGGVPFWASIFFTTSIPASGSGRVHIACPPLHMAILRKKHQSLWKILYAIILLQTNHSDDYSREYPLFMINDSHRYSLTGARMEHNMMLVSYNLRSGTTPQVTPPQMGAWTPAIGSMTVLDGWSSLQHPQLVLHPISSRAVLRVDEPTEVHQCQP